MINYSILQADKVESPKLFEIGPVRVSPHSIFMATVSALIVVPINVFIVVLFRNRRDRVKKTKIQPEEVSPSLWHGSILESLDSFSCVKCLSPSYLLENDVIDLFVRNRALPLNLIWPPERRAAPSQW